jgi:hypothetical protein
MKNRLTPHEEKMIELGEMALDVERHRCLQTGSFEKKAKAFWQQIFEYRREDRREAARKARKVTA